jgi:hypothetical protein
MAFTSDVYRTQFASALKYHYPTEVMQRLCFRKENILQYLNKIKAPGGGRTDLWGINTYPADDSRAAAETAALITPTGEQFTDAYVTLKNRYTRRFVSSAVLDDSKVSETALIKAVNWYPQEIARRHAFTMARNAWYTGGTGFAALGNCTTTSSSTTINLASNFNFRRIFRGMKVDYILNTAGTVVSGGGALTISDYDEAACTVTNASTSIATETTTVMAVQGEVHSTAATTYATYAWNSIPMLVGTGNVCNVTASSYPEYRSKVYTSVGTLGLSDIQAAVDWVEGHAEGPNISIHTSPEVIIKYADIFLGDVRLTQQDLAFAKMGYPNKLAYRGGSMGLIPIEKDHLAPRDELYIINWDSMRLFNSAFMQWFEEDGSYLHRNQGYMEYELLFYSRGELAILNRIGCAALLGILI